MRLKIIVLSAVFFLGLDLLAKETPDVLRTQGFSALKAAQSDPDQLVVAAKLLAQAADGFATAGKESEAEEVNSALYWAKKKMTIQQIETFVAKGDATAKATVAKLEAVEKREVKQDDAGKWLERADGYAETAKDPFLAAVRYFEVASRFKGSPEGEQALEKSLKSLQGAKVAQDPSKVIGRAVKGDGKVYVQSAPVGASILVEAEDGLRDTGSKTPSLVQLPKGKATLVLRKHKYEDLKVLVQIGDAIVKTEVMKLSFPKVDVEILSAESGWRVFLLDGNKPVSLRDKTRRLAVTPCTVCIEEGQRTVVLGKEGFVDQSKKVAVGKDQVVNFDQKGRAGQSQVIAWDKVNNDPTGKYEVFADGKSAGFIVLFGDHKVQNIRGERKSMYYWRSEDDKIFIQWWTTSTVLIAKGNGKYICEKNSQLGFSEQQDLYLIKK